MVFIGSQPSNPKLPRVHAPALPRVPPIYRLSAASTKTTTGVVAVGPQRCRIYILQMIAPCCRVALGYLYSVLSPTILYLLYGAV